MALHLGRKVETISIIPEGPSGGRVTSRLPTLLPTWQDTLDTIAITLGGRGADLVLGCGAHAGAQADLAEATQMLLDAHERQGLGKTLVYMPEEGSHPMMLLQAVNTELEGALARAKCIVEANRESLLALVDRLIEGKVLTGDDALAIVGPPRALMRPRRSSPSRRRYRSVQKTLQTSIED